MTQVGALATARFAVASWLLSFVLTLALAGPVVAETSPVFPALTGRVVDDAGIIDPARHAAITKQLADYEAKTTDQIVVVTLKSLQGTTIEEFGYRLGRSWQIGQAGKNNGALLIVAPNERKVRIEVGYGLEGTLTDAIARVIIDTAILPKFRTKDFAGGIAAGVDAIIDVLTHDDSEWKARAVAPPPEPDWVGLVIVGAIIVIIVIVFILSAHGGGPPARGRSRDFVVGSGASSGGSWSGGSGGGFSGGGGSFGGGGSSGDW
ncbi:TPM domain-containing protein [Blastochloris viridis]|uniref:TPM domain-containing protein n=1 Tax=Blastochloris viridis TaxID=1079 RepID=UPI0006D74902|nr:TPM domain-containing protein [Blastochloris viridis]ALK10969.1 hypothetical protein BVIR_3212 [Blastochloris viridis]